MGAVTDLSQNETGNAIEAISTDSISAKRPYSRHKPLVGAYVALLLFMVIYCARPEDWIPSLSNVPLAKISGVLVLLALVFSLRHMRQRLPRAVIYLALLVGQLFLASVLSPVWRSGAVQATLDFAKILIIVIVIAVAVNTAKRLRLLIFIQAGSVAVIAAVAVLRGRLLDGRLAGMLGGSYSNPNELAITIVISLPLCLALLFVSRGRVWKAAWAVAILVMTYAVFLTGSRGGFLTLIFVTVVCLWEFAIRMRQRYLLVLAALAGVVLWQSSSGMVAARLNGTFNSEKNEASAYESSQLRQQMFWRSIEVTVEHPLFGIGPGNFMIVSGKWMVTHNSFTQMSSEGGALGFILFVLILWCGIKSLRATKRLAREQRESRLLAGALQASIAGYIVGSLFYSAAYDFVPYLLVAYATALLGITKKSVSDSKVQEEVSQETTETSVNANASASDLSWISE